MTCENCEHYEACNFWIAMSDIARMFFKGECVYFKDKSKEKSRMIELPCKVGDTVWYLNKYWHIALQRNKVYEARVARIVLLQEAIFLSLRLTTEGGVCMEAVEIKEIGKTVFLTREEAEKALKALEEKDEEI